MSPIAAVLFLVIGFSKGVSALEGLCLKDQFRELMKQVPGGAVAIICSLVVDVVGLLSLRVVLHGETNWGALRVR